MTFANPEAFSRQRASVAWTLTFAVLVITLFMKFTQLISMHQALDDVVGPTAGIGAAAIVGMVLLLLPIMLEAPWAAGRWTIAAQAVLAFAPYLVLGLRWGPSAGLLCAVILLVMRLPAAWLMAGCVAAAEVAVIFSLGGEPWWQHAQCWLMDLNIGLSVFVLTRLAQSARRAEEARRGLSSLRVAEERLRLARGLRNAVGVRLSAIVARLPRTPAVDQSTRDRLTEIADLARGAHTETRLITQQEISRPPVHDTRPDHDPGTPYVLARRIMFGSVLLNVLIAITNVSFSGVTDVLGTMVSIALILAAGGLQLRHGAPRESASPPRAWPWTLTLHFLLIVGIVVGAGVTVMTFLFAGAVLVRVRMPWSALVVGAVAVAAGIIGFYGRPEPAWHVYVGLATISCAATSLAFCRLPDVNRHLLRTRRQVAGLAVVTERLRVARDIHDRLGFHLSAIALKAELAARLLTADPGRARRHLADLRHTADVALAESRSIVSGSPDLTFAEEAEAARTLLAAADVSVRLDLGGDRPPPVVDQLLAVVLREAVTNVIRHSSAENCSISVTTNQEIVRLVVTNDRADEPAGDPRPGTGLASLATRVESAGGALTTTMARDVFTLTVRLPVKPESEVGGKPVASSWAAGR